MTSNSRPSAAASRKTNIYFATAVLFFVSLLNAFDRQVALVVAEPIRGEWHLSDAQVGLIAGVFTLAYAICGIPMGVLADRVSRFRFLAGAALIWSIFTALGGAARNYTQLLASRLAVGIAESSFFPTSISLLGDLFPAHKRNRAVGVVMIGIPVGIALSFGIGGAVAKANGWRAAFLLALVPGIVASLACSFTREPARGASEEYDIGAKRRGASSFKILARIPTFRIIVCASALHMFTSFSQAAFLAPFLMRYHRMSVDEAGKALSIVAGLAPIVGMVASSALTDRLISKRHDAPMLVGLVSFALAIPATLIALGCGVEDRFTLLLSLAVAQILVFPFISFQQTIVTNVVEPSLRGTAIAVQSLAASIFGAALGPMTTGVLSDTFARRAAGAAPGVSLSQEALEPYRAEGLHQALYVVPIGMGVLCIILWLGLRGVRRDTAALSEWMAAAAQAGGGGSHEDIARVEDR